LKVDPETFPKTFDAWKVDPERSEVDPEAFRKTFHAWKVRLERLGRTFQGFWRPARLFLALAEGSEAEVLEYTTL